MDICDVKCIHEDKVRKTQQSLPSDENIIRMVDIFKALSDPTRLKIVLALLNREHCVCDIAVLCNQSDSAVSHQLRILRT
ncbi:MAG: metalloregulator ArsR/SmtB family transcription factor, partial [Desulfotignum sp.]